MKNRIKAILLACSLSVSMLAIPSYAETAEMSTETAAVTGTATSQAAQESEEVTEAAGSTSQAESETEASSLEDQLAAVLDETLSELSAMTDDQLDYYIENGSDSTKKLMTSWKEVKEELGVYESIESESLSEENNVYTLRAKVNYDQVSDNTDVYVSFVYDAVNQTTDLTWDVEYPMSHLLAQAGMNTLLGLGIVFLVLIFLSFIISRFKFIGNRKDRKKTEEEAVKAAAETETAAETEEAEENLANDEELVAVIAAAIAASEGTGTDGFVVRSIKKANRKKWQNA